MNTDQPTATATPRTAEQARVDAHIHLQNERIPRVTPEQALIDWATFARTLASELSSSQAALAEAKANNDALRVMLAKCTPLDVSERAELYQLRDREEISKATNDQLRARVAELEADKARLDWLEQHSCAFPTDEVQTIKFETPRQNTDDYEKPTVRAAIDAAKGTNVHPVQPTQGT